MRIRIIGTHEATQDRARIEVDAPSAAAAIQAARRDGVVISSVTMLEGGDWVPIPVDVAGNSESAVRPRKRSVGERLMLGMLLLVTPFLPLVGAVVVLLIALAGTLLFAAPLRSRAYRFLGLTPGRLGANTLQAVLIVGYASALGLGTWIGVDNKREAKEHAMHVESASALVEHNYEQAVEHLNAGRVDEARGVLLDSLAIHDADNLGNTKALIQQIKCATSESVVRDRLLALSETRFRAFEEHGTTPPSLDLGFAILTESALEIAQSQVPQVAAERRAQEQARAKTQAEERDRSRVSENAQAQESKHVASTDANWYERGTLHKGTLKDWRNASERDKLATCADFAATLFQSSTGRVPSSMDELKPHAIRLVDAIDDVARTKGVESIRIAEIASASELLSNSRGD